MDDSRRYPWAPPTDKPPGPQRISSRARSTLVPGSGITPIFTDVREINRYPLITTLFFNLATTDPLLALPQPGNGLRTFLTVRNQAASAGNVFVGFGTTGGDANSTFELVPGAVALLDYSTPQNDVWLTAVSTAGVVISYANIVNAVLP